jgi:serine/threonine protein kinase
MPGAADGDRRLGERLVGSGRLSRDQLQACLAEQQARGGAQRIRLAAIFLEKGVLAAPAPAPVPDAETAAAIADPARRVGGYALVKEIGRGAVGVVYRGVHVATGKLVAIKTIVDPNRRGGENVRRFQIEAAAARRLHHPAIVAAHEVGEKNGMPYLVMDLVEGESLEALLARHLPQRWIAQLARGIALALEHAHRNGVVHRDVKPENVIVDREGQPHLTDFGLARDAAGADRMTQEGQMIGTPAFMAPEQAGEVSEQGPHSDIYSLGAVLYRALTGKPPFKATSVAALLKKLLFEKPVPPREVRPDIHPDLEKIVLRCLEKDPKDRYASAGEVAAALERFMALASTESGDGETEVPAPVPPEPAPPEPAPPEPVAGSAAPAKRGPLAVSSRTRVRGAAPSGERRRRGGPADDERRTLTTVLLILIPVGILFLVVVAVVASR